MNSSPTEVPTSPGKGTSDGVTLVELLVALAIFSFGLIPILSLGRSQTFHAYSASKHFLAGQMAANILEVALHMPFEDCRTWIESFSGNPRLILEERELFGDFPEGIPETLRKANFDEEVKRTLRSFQFVMEKEESTDPEESMIMFTVRVRVSWLVKDEEESTRQQVVLETVKFTEDSF